MNTEEFCILKSSNVEQLINTYEFDLDAIGQGGIDMENGIDEFNKMRGLTYVNHNLFKLNRNRKSY